MRKLGAERICFKTGPFDPKDLIRIIKYCLSLIKNERMKQIVNMWLYQLKQKQIASLLDVTIGYVGGTLNRGKEIFRKCVMENYQI